MESWKGNRTPSNPQEGYYVGLMNACGYRTKDLEKPVIGIVNSFTDVNPGHRAFKELVGYVKEGVWAAGGTPAEFNVPAPCDGMAQGEGMHFILPSRDLIAGSIQAMASAHGFDGLVFLCSCDKIVPGMLMAAATLNKPCMFLTAGSMLPYEADEGTYVTPDLKESIGQRNIDAISEETFTRFRENICFSCGTCSMYGTANTMGVFAEAIGLCPIDSTTMLFCSSAKYKQARDVGERIVTLTKEGVRFSDIVTEASLKNGLRHVAATGGSTNAQLHICALARVMGIPMDLAAFDAIQRDVPCVAKFKPSSKFNMYDYYKAGGVGATMKAIERYLDPDARLATGGTVGEFLARFRRRVDPEIIHTADEPLYPDGCFAVLHGNLAPDGCIVKKSGVVPEMFHHRGPAVCFDSEDALRAAMTEKSIKPGDVLVIRYEGPKGGPGMREMSIPAAMLVGMGLLVSLLGPVIQLTFLGVLSMTQALVPIGVVVVVVLVASTAVSLVYGQNGSRLLARVSADGRGGAMPRDNHTIHLEVSDEELAERLGHIKRPAHPAPGVLGAYRKAVDSVNEGCTWLYGKEE